MVNVFASVMGAGAGLGPDPFSKRRPPRWRWRSKQKAEKSWLSGRVGRRHLCILIILKSSHEQGWLLHVIFQMKRRTTKRMIQLSIWYHCWLSFHAVHGKKISQKMAAETYSRFVWYLWSFCESLWSCNFGAKWQWRFNMNDPTLSQSQSLNQLILPAV